MGRFHDLKKRVGEILRHDRWRERLSELQDAVPKELVGPLFSLLVHPGRERFRAAALFGETVARMAEQRLEDGRVVMRRCMWNLNEESGSLGWGSAEAMAEAMVAHEPLAREFSRVLVSYIHDTGKVGNYLDHAALRKGAFWGVARLCHARPGLMGCAAEALITGLGDREDPEIPGLAAWGLAALRDPRSAPALAPLLDDPTLVELFRHERMEQTSVAALAREALAALGKAP